MESVTDAQTRSKWSGTNGGEPSPTIGCSSHGSQSQGRSSEGCNISGEHEEHEEQFVEADGERFYLSDGEIEAIMEPTVLPEKEQSVLYDPDNPRIELNALFPDVESFRNGLRHFAIKTDFEYTTVKSDKKRFVANCAYPGCSWRIRACRLREDNKTFKMLSRKVNGKLEKLEKLLSRKVNEKLMAS